MPIRPENRKRYPKDWKQISHRIRFKRAMERCECTGECGIEHGEENDSFGVCVPGYAGYPDERCSAHHDQPHHATGSQVMLAVAHLDHQPENCEDSNLKAMCQRCHNRMDAPYRRAGIGKRRREQQAIGELL